MLRNNLNGCWVGGEKDDLCQEVPVLTASRWHWGLVCRVSRPASMADVVNKFVPPSNDCGARSPSDLYPSVRENGQLTVMANFGADRRLHSSLYVVEGNLAHIVNHIIDACGLRE